MRLTLIEKSKTLELKGIAIFMMLFLHLFNKTENVRLCTTAGISVGNEPLVQFLSHGMGPVSFYLFLSGYGLYYKYRKNGGVISGVSRNCMSFTGLLSCCSEASAVGFDRTFIPEHSRMSSAI